VARFDLIRGKEVALLAPGWPAARLSLSHDGRLLAVASTERKGVQVRDAETGKVLRELPHPVGVQAVVWAPSGGLLVSGCDDHRIYLWDAKTGERRGTLEGHRWEVHDLAFDASGRWLMSFGWEMALRVWDELARRTVLVQENVRVVSFRTEGGLAAAAVSGERAQVWSFHPSDVYAALSGLGDSIYGVTFDPDGRWVAADTLSGNVWVWDVATKTQVAHFPDLGFVFWGPEGKWLFTNSRDGVLRWPVRPLDRHGAGGVRAGPPQLHHGPTFVPNLKEGFFPFGRRRQYFVRAGNRVRVFAAEGAARELWSAELPGSIHLAASPDGSLLAGGSFQSGGGVRVWDVETGRLQKELAIGDAIVFFSADGRWLFTTTGRMAPRGPELRAWRVGTWEPGPSLRLARTSSSPAHGCALPSDGTLAVAYTQEQLRLVRPESFAELATLTAPEPGLIVGCVAIPDGGTLACTSSHSVHLWDLRRLRSALSDLGLDWDMPPPPPAPAPPPGPLRFELDFGPRRTSNPGR
jgi:WD40 repeat protein